MEPERVALRENELEWMDAVRAFYEGMAWDITVHNNETSMMELVRSVMGGLKGHSGAVASTVEAHAEVVHAWGEERRGEGKMEESKGEEKEGRLQKQSHTHKEMVCPATPLMMLDGCVSMDGNLSACLSFTSSDTTRVDEGTGITGEPAFTYTLEDTDVLNMSMNTFISPLKGRASPVFVSPL
jgi:hypothetical protein